MFTMSITIRRLVLTLMLAGFVLNPLAHLHPISGPGSMLQQDPCKFCASGGNIVFVPDPPPALPLPTATELVVTAAPSLAFRSVPVSSSRGPPTV